MKPPPSSSVEPTPLSGLYTKSQSVATGDNCRNRSLHHADSAPCAPSTENDSVKELLKKILNVLETRVHNEEEQSYEDKKEDEIKKNWMLAAAVIDRICAIAFTIVFIGGTVTFVAVFVAHP